jgi:lipopolysaccharide transport system ATP-binding protein
MNTVISVENLWKRYQLGVINNGQLYRDLQSAFARALGKEDPWSRIGEESRFDKRGSFWALKDVCFEVKQGDCVGIIGQNGAGKSTLLKIITRITTPTKGQVKIKGKITSLLEVGTGFHQELTGRENVYLNGAILGMKREEISKKFDQIVEFSEIGEFIDTPVKRYSSGMKVRLAFSVAAHLDSEILITDEVLAVGDAKFRKKCLDKMMELRNEESRTMLFVSHNLLAVRNLCTSAIVLEQGRIIGRFDDSNQAVDFYLARLNVKESMPMGDEQ